MPTEAQALLDRDQVNGAIASEVAPWMESNIAGAVEAATTQVMGLARSMPTRAEIEQVLTDHAVGRHVPKEAAGYRAVIADAILSLLNGE